MRYPKTVAGLLLLTLFLLASGTAQASPLDTIKIRSGGVISDQEFVYTNPLLTLPHGMRSGVAFSVEAKVADVPGGWLLAKVQYIPKGIVFQTATTTRSARGATTSIHAYDSRADYLSVPILYQIVIPGLPFLVYANAGPRVDFLLHAQSEAFPGVYDHLRSVTAGAEAGLGIEYPSDPFTISAELHYSHDFTDAFETSSLRVRNRALGIWVGVGLL